MIGAAQPLAYTARAGVVGGGGEHAVAVELGRKRLSVGQPFDTTLDELLEWDRQRRQPQLLFASLSGDLPRNDRVRQLRRYESGLEALLVNNDPLQESQAYQGVVRGDGEHQRQRDTVQRWTQGETHRLFQKAFWLERPDGTRKRATLVLNAQRRALRQEAQLAHALKLIEQPHLDRLLEVLNTPLAAQRVGSDTRVLQVAVGGTGADRYSLMGVFVVTTANALAKPALPQPVVLVVGGSFGGLEVFERLDALALGLQASLGSRDDSVLWRCIGRDVRPAARFAMSKSVQVDYTRVDHDVLLEDFKASDDRGN